MGPSTYKMRIDPLGVTVEVGDRQTLLDACLRAGLWIPHACCHGLCGTCKVRVLEGVVDQGAASSFALMDFERSEGWALACSARPLSDIRLEADTDDDPDAEVHPLAEYTARVARIETLTPDIKGIFLELGGDGLSFQAGQYVSVHIPGLDCVRPFSIASSPSRQNMLELNVRLVEGGTATGFLHHVLKAGDELQVSGPYGRFFVRKSSSAPIVFVAGGSGLSSPKSMILDLLEAGDDRSVTLLHGARTRKDLYYRDLFESIAADRPNFTYIPCLSIERPSTNWHGESGFVHEVLERRFGASLKGSRVYLCGPPPMIDATVPVLMRARLFERDIFYEKFLSAADLEHTRARSPLFRRA